MSERPPPPDRRRFGWFMTMATRFSDNDMFGHMNNAVYYSFMDTSIGRFLTERSGFDPLQSPVMIFAAENSCRFHLGLHYPDLVHVGLAVERIGTSSVTWDIGLFANDDPLAAANGTLVHVVVDRENRRPTPIPKEMRAALGSIMREGGQST